MKKEDRTVKADQLPENVYVSISGKIDYARLTSQISGEALDKYNAVRKYKIKRPFTKATLREAQVRPVDASAPNLVEVFVAEHCYQSKDDPQGPFFFEAINKGNNLPVVCQRNADGNVTPVVLTGELATGVPVTLILKSYASGDNANRGIALEYVVIEQQGDIPYYSSDNGQLEKLGLNFTEPPKAQPAVPANETVAQASTNQPAAPENSVVENGLVMPGPAPQQTGPMAAPAAPAQPVAPAQASPMAQPQAPAQQPAVPAAPAPQQTAPASPMAQQAMTPQVAAQPTQPVGSPFLQGVPTAVPLDQSAPATTPESAPAADQPDPSIWSGPEETYVQP